MSDRRIVVHSSGGRFVADSSVLSLVADLDVGNFVSGSSVSWSPIFAQESFGLYPNTQEWGQ